jgi:hypothetical protein
MQLIQTKNNVIRIIILLISIELYSQNKTNEFYIYKDDTCYIKKALVGDKFFYYSFNDSLKDGRWFVYNIQRKDSSSSYKRVILKGLFKNNKREGLFETFEYFPNNETENTHYYFCSYKDGKKHGVEEEYFIYKIPNIRTLLFHGEYNNGKEDGCFINIEKDGYLSRQSHYKNGVLLNSAIYSGNKSSRNREIEFSVNGEEKYIQYSYDDSIYKTEYFIRNETLEYINLIDYNNRIVKKRDCNLKISTFSSLYQIPSIIINLNKEILMNDELFLKYINDNK